LIQHQYTSFNFQNTKLKNINKGLILSASSSFRFGTISSYMTHLMAVVAFGCIASTGIQRALSLDVV